MDDFLPSEVARLVLGYLKETNCLKSWETLIEENNSLHEYYWLFKHGITCSTTIDGKSLKEILSYYCSLKQYGDKIVEEIKRCEQEYNSDPATRIDIVEEIANMVSLAFQKYHPLNNDKRDCKRKDECSVKEIKEKEKEFKNNKYKKRKADETESSSINCCYSKHAPKRKLLDLFPSNTPEESKKIQVNRTPTSESASTIPEAAVSPLQLFSLIAGSNEESNKVIAVSESQTQIEPQRMNIENVMSVHNPPKMIQSCYKRKNSENCVLLESSDELNESSKLVTRNMNGVKTDTVVQNNNLEHKLHSNESVNNPQTQKVNTEDIKSNNNVNTCENTVIQVCEKNIKPLKEKKAEQNCKEANGLKKLTNRKESEVQMSEDSKRLTQNKWDGPQKKNICQLPETELGTKGIEHSMYIDTKLQILSSVNYKKLDEHEMHLLINKSDYNKEVLENFIRNLACRKNFVPTTKIISGRNLTKPSQNFYESIASCSLKASIHNFNNVCGTSLKKTVETNIERSAESGSEVSQSCTSSLSPENVCDKDSGSSEKGTSENPTELIKKKVISSEHWAVVHKAIKKYGYDYVLRKVKQYNNNH